MPSDGGRGKNRRGLPANPVTEEGYAVSLRLRVVRCGSPRCRACRDGPSHGPYWYEVFWDSAGRVHSRYRGRAT